MNGKEGDLKRLHKMILKEELRLPSGAVEVLKSELLSTLECYFDIKEDTFYFSVGPCENGYEVFLHAEAAGVKKVRGI